MKYRITATVGKTNSAHCERKCTCTTNLDHAHEQMNVGVKGMAGVIGLTERSDALLHWMVSGPEIAQLLTEFESASDNEINPDVLHHHESNPSHERRFMKHVTSLVAAFEELGNPFLDGSGKLFAIDSKNVASEDVMKIVQTTEQLGKLWFNSYFQERLIDCTQAVTVKIRRNKLPLFRTSAAAAKPVAKIKLASALQDSMLFSQLFVAGQKRKTDLNTFYRAMHYSAVLRLHGIRLSICPSVCNVGGSGPHRLEILETDWTDISPTPSLFAAQKASAYAQGNMGKF